MTKALITLTEPQNRILNIVKAKYGLSNKSEAIEHIIQVYEEEYLEPELRPEFIEKILKVDKEKSIRVKSFAERYGLD